MALLVAAATTLAIGSPAFAADPTIGNAKPPTVREVQDIYARANSTGSLTAYDISRLRLLPEADDLIDPGTAELRADDVYTVAASGCQAKDRYIVYKSVTRSKTVDYHFTVNWCYKSSVIDPTVTRGHYIKSYTVGMYDRGFTNNTLAWTRTNHYSAQIDLQGKFEQCILKYGCLFSANPRSRWGIYGNGDYTYTGYN